MSLLLLIAVFLVTFLLVFELRLRLSYLYRNVMKMYKGPKYWPIIGNSLEFIGCDPHDLYLKFQQICVRNERFTRLWLGPRVYVVLSTAKDIEILLSSTSEIKKSNIYAYLYDWIGTGLLTSSGAKWKSRRKIITPAFHFKILQDFLPVFNSNGQIFMEKLTEKAGKGTFNVYELVNLYSLDNVCETALGVKINAQKDAESEYAKAVKDMRSVISERSFKFWLDSDFIFNLTEFGKMHRKALNILHWTTESIIKERKEKLQDLKDSSSVEEALLDDIGQKRRLAFLDCLILSGELSDQDIREEVDTFMFEGHDTVTSGISFALYSLAHNPKVQEAVYREQMEIFGDSDRDPTPKDLQEMKYLETVLKESLRMHPSVPIFGRTIQEDLPLRDGYFLPGGSQCIVNVALLHRDPNVWPNPDQFNPDNFSPEAAKNRNPYAYIPFSAGPRNCIGQRYAMMEMKCLIGKAIRKFKFNRCSDGNNEAKITGQLILFSLNGINLEVENRL